MHIVQQEELQSHPGWKHALDMIVMRVENQGRGVFFSHVEMKEWMDLEEPKTIREAEKLNFKYMNNIDNLRKELLVDHQMWLENKRGDGYTILHPDDQVSIPIDKTLTQVRKEIRKAKSILDHVDNTLLSLDANAVRLKNYQRVAFIRQSLNKRKFPVIEAEDQKLLL